MDQNNGPNIMWSIILAPFESIRAFKFVYVYLNDSDIGRPYGGCRLILKTAG